MNADKKTYFEFNLRLSAFISGYKNNIGLMFARG